MNKCAACGAPVRIEGLRSVYDPPRANLLPEERNLIELTHTARMSYERYVRYRDFLQRVADLEFPPGSSAVGRMRWFRYETEQLLADDFYLPTPWVERGRKERREQKT